MQTCVDEVEKRGLTEVGVYRVAGVMRDVQELRQSFDTGTVTFWSIFVLCQKLVERNAGSFDLLLMLCSIHTLELGGGGVHVNYLLCMERGTRNKAL